MTHVSKRPESRFDWFIPIVGAGNHIGTLKAEYSQTFENLRKIVNFAEESGYYSMLIPTRFANGLFESEELLAENWTTGTALAAVQ